MTDFFLRDLKVIEETSENEFAQFTMQVMLEIRRRYGDDDGKKKIRELLDLADVQKALDLTTRQRSIFLKFLLHLI